MGVTTHAPRIRLQSICALHALHVHIRRCYCACEHALLLQQHVLIKLKLPAHAIISAIIIIYGHVVTWGSCRCAQPQPVSHQQGRRRLPLPKPLLLLRAC